MPVCDICSEELASEAEMKTHLLLGHLENSLVCPFCSLSGVLYDDLTFHINTAHAEDVSSSIGTFKIPKASGPSKQTCMENKAAALLQPSMSHINPSATLFKEIRPPSKGSSTASDTENGAKKLVRTRETPNGCESRFSCPMCSLVCGDSVVLLEHVEVHLQNHSTIQVPQWGNFFSAFNPSDQTSTRSSGQPYVGASSEGCSRNKDMMDYECPICFLRCSCSSLLQEHVELHLDHGSVSASSRPSPGDLTMAKKLQEQEEEIWKEELVQREAEDFKKLQMIYGLDNRGGYRKQIERHMEKAVSRGLMLPVEFHRKRSEMLESLASGVDDGTSKTSGLMEALHTYYQSETSCRHVWLCAATDHYCCSEGDSGWGCGYRNFQMLFSSLQKMEQYNLPVSVPSIPRVQALIEEAWSQGVDPQGASHFNNRLQGTRAWIGATEIYSLLISSSIKAQIVDFHKPTGPGDTHPRLFEWVKRYFSNSDSSRRPPRIVETTLPPVYLQHQGHSRSIVGVELTGNGKMCLLLFDPKFTSLEMGRLLSQDTASTIIRKMRTFPSDLKHKQYQVVFAEGLLSPEEQRACIQTSQTLCVEKIP